MPMPTTSRQAERSHRSSEALLDAAAELISEGGLGSMTFAAIGDRAGYSRGLVTARFGSKAGLVDALVRRVWGRLREARAVPLAHGEHGLDELVGLIAAIRDQTSENPRDVGALLALMFEALGTDPELRTRMASFHENMRADIADAVSRGETTWDAAIDRAWSRASARLDAADERQKQRMAVAAMGSP